MNLDILPQKVPDLTGKAWLNDTLAGTGKGAEAAAGTALLMHLATCDWSSEALTHFP